VSVRSGAAANVLQTSTITAIAKVSRIIATGDIILLLSCGEQRRNIRYVQPKLSVRQLEEALRIRREIDALEKRLGNLLGGKAVPRPRFSLGTRAKLSAAMKARWARIRGKAKEKSGDLPTLNPGTKYRP
jgi:hypothetical protein